MILPISVYGTTVLRKEAQEIDQNYTGLQEIIKNMYETLEKADGVGLAAPQVGNSIRLFIVNASKLEETNGEDMSEFKKVFINPIILEEEGEEVSYQEGCLSVPGIYEEVSRKSKIKIEYYDENFVLKEENYDGYKARIIQHEYDHLDGIIFTDHLSGIKKRLLKGKLSAIVSGKTKTAYKVRRATR